jgi:hypothetical protein
MIMAFWTISPWSLFEGKISKNDHMMLYKMSTLLCKA